MMKFPGEAQLNPRERSVALSQCQGVGGSMSLSLGCVATLAPRAPTTGCTGDTGALGGRALDQES